jgi:transposase-like protein
MARQVNQVRWDQWRQVIARQRASGLTVAEFCRKENVSRQGFHVWKRKLRQATSASAGSDVAAAAEPSRKRRSLAAGRRRLGLVPPRPSTALSAAPAFLQLPVTAVRPSPWIEVALPDGTIVRLPQQNLAALVAVLRAAGGEPLDLPEGAARA